LLENLYNNQLKVDYTVNDDRHNYKITIKQQSNATLQMQRKEKHWKANYSPHVTEQHTNYV